MWVPSSDSATAPVILFFGDWSETLNDVDTFNSSDRFGVRTDTMMAVACCRETRVPRYSRMRSTSSQYGEFSGCLGRITV
jgi:hypothetical protein